MFHGRWQFGFLVFLCAAMIHSHAVIAKDSLKELEEIESTAETSNSGTVSQEDQGSPSQNKVALAPPENSKRMGLVIVHPAWLNFRQAPWGKIIGRLDHGETVEILATEGEWFKVKRGETEGYGHSEFITLESACPQCGFKSPGGEDTPVAISPPAETGSNPPPAETVPASPPPPESPPSSPPPERGAVQLDGGGVEIAGMTLQGQLQGDPYDADDGKGTHPYSYCGPTSLQMVLDYHGVKKSRDYLALTPVNGAKMLVSPDVGSAYGPMVAMARSLGFENSRQRWGVGIQQLKELLSEGRPQIISASGRIRDRDGGNYYTGGHIMVVTGVCGNGDFILMDPYDPGGNPKRRVVSQNDFLAIWNWQMTVDIH